MSTDDRLHVSDDRLLMARAGRHALRRQERAHLAGCPECARRDRQWADALVRSRAGAAQEADAAFPESRLARQRQRILDRLTLLAPARVLSFPTAQGRPAPRPHRLRTRWIAAAAAVGLIVGALTGQHVNFRPYRNARRPAPVEVSVSSATSTQRVGDHAAFPSDDEFLLQVDSAIGRSSARELRALDEFTPRLREAAIQVR